MYKYKCCYLSSTINTINKVLACMPHFFRQGLFSYVFYLLFCPVHCTDNWLMAGNGYLEENTDIHFLMVSCVTTVHESNFQLSITKTVQYTSSSKFVCPANKMKKADVGCYILSTINTDHLYRYFGFTQIWTKRINLIVGVSGPIIRDQLFSLRNQQQIIKWNFRTD